MMASRVMRLGGAVLLGLMIGVGSLSSAERVVEAAVAPTTYWQWLPRGAYLGETITAQWATAQPAAWQWASDAEAGLTTSAIDNQVGLSVVANLTTRSVTGQGPDGQHTGISVVHAGDRVALAVGLDGELRGGPHRAVLVHQRQDPQEIREWAWLRAGSQRQPDPAGLVVLPPAVGWGHSALLAQVAALRQRPLLHSSVVVVLGVGECDVGWHHESLRQVLGFLISDLAARGVTDITLIPPPAPAAVADTAAALTGVVREAAQAYGAQVLPVPELAAPAWWEVANGIPGSALNAAGIAERERLLGPITTTHARWWQPPATAAAPRPVVAPQSDGEALDPADGEP